MSSIKPKIGNCSKCGKEAPLTSGRCHSCYWNDIRAKSAEKSKGKEKRSIIPLKSVKQLNRDIEYAKLRKKWITEHKICEAHLKGCKQAANQVHHKQGREGSLMLDTSKWLAVCHNCHMWITEHSNESIEMGLSLKRNQ